ncbi:hypothetical protein Q764_09520 [Flavobacterium suncheonense GH29-5 = DSM 17707]|uniref:Group I intron homing endonuclease n=1 Tax=Flavobacterium suncheonense GH29-5 = DSM 17707 TaxID=1121899 RepID=A0A0A2MBY3_9FLAO|nr:hypothetical protein Q764_09520 [Flavobacterium suncheonense GH29-5 = DSM 17707]
MRKANFFFGLLALLFLISCNKEKQQHDAVLPAATGKINTISVIIDDVLWNGEIGDTLRKKLAAPVDGLQEEEPLFTINQFSPKIFDQTVKLSRNIIVISKGHENEFKHVENQYASPQNVFYFKGPTLSEIIATIELHANTLVSSLKFYELIEQQRRAASGAFFDDKRLKEKFGITLQIPAAFSYAVVKKQFVWLKKDIPSGNSSLLIYRVPFSRIDPKKELVSSIVSLRDSIGRLYIKGLADQASMITEESYAPYFNVTKIDQRKALETRGTWELENSFMNGPFINYIIQDDKTQSYIVIEGFVYNPSTAKRDMMFELEAIIKSVQFLK